MIIRTTLILLLVVVFLIVQNPLRLPDSVIEYYLLYISPIGTSFDVVEKTIKQKEWRIAYSSRKIGFYDQRTKPATTVGAMSIRSELGHYQGLPFQGSVSVFWGFDAQGKLIEIWVWRTWDGF